MFGEDRHREARRHSNPDEAIQLFQSLAIEELVSEIPEELASIAVWLDARIAARFHHLEETMTQLSEQVTALTNAVQGVADRVSAEIADLETKIVDPDTVVTADDLAGIKTATDQLNSIAATPVAPAEGGDTPPADTPPTEPAPPTDTPPTDTPPVDPGTVDGTTTDTPPAENTPPQGGDAAGQ